MILQQIEQHTLNHSIVIDSLVNLLIDKGIISEKEWYKIEPIHDREDKNTFIDYLLKQVPLFTDDNYNYKINQKMYSICKL